METKIQTNIADSDQTASREAVWTTVFKTALLDKHFIIKDQY